MKRVLPAFAALLCLSASAPQEKSIAWAKSWSEAMEEASIRNVPVYLTIHMDGCSICAKVEKSAYPNAEVIAVAKNMVCLVGHGGAKDFPTTHGTKEVKVVSEKVNVCKIYAGISCSDHVDVFKERVPPLFKGQKFPTPHHVYFSPSGEELLRNSGPKEPGELAKEFADMLAKVGGTHVPKDEYDGAKSQIDAGKALAKKDEIKKAIEAFTKVSKHKNERLQALGTKELDALSAAGDMRLQAATQTMESQGGEEKAKKELKKIADEYAPFACAEKAKEILRQMKEKGR